MSPKPTKIKSFKDTKASQKIEPDRYQLEAGHHFIVDDFILDDKNSYKENIVKINGREITGVDDEGSPIPGEKVKFWTFASVIREKLKALQDGKELPCEVEVIEKLSKANRPYLDFKSGMDE